LEIAREQQGAVVVLEQRQAPVFKRDKAGGRGVERANRGELHGRERILRWQERVKQVDGEGNDVGDGDGLAEERQ
jgi:hypothetical protein